MSDVKVYFDLACPYCYLARGFWLKMQEECPIEMDWVPWEAHPEYPPKGRPREGDEEGRLEKLRALGGNIRGFETNARWPNTHNALLGLEYARSKGKVDQYIERLYEAYFAEKTDISGWDEVVRLGAEIGLDKEALQKSIREKEYEQTLIDWDQEAEGMGLEVVPSFVQQGVLVLEGSTTMDFKEFREKYLEIWGDC